MTQNGVKCLSEALSSLRIASKPSHLRTFTRSLATEATTPTTHITRAASTNQLIQSWAPTSTVPLTVHAFPSLEPKALEQWSVEHLYLPLRRDLLHLAVVYEGDSHRQGTAHAKNRYEIKASGRKLRPQKGSGRARQGDAGSPILRGGGKAHGPRHRDFSTKLNKKVYDKAWRTALSYRYRRGELVVCEDGMELKLPSEFEKMARMGILKSAAQGDRVLEEAYIAKYMRGVLDALHWGQDHGRTLFVTQDERKRLFEAMDLNPKDGRSLVYDDVDVKDLLETGRVVMERSVLKEMIESHQSDLVSSVVINGFKEQGPETGVKVIGA